MDFQARHTASERRSGGPETFQPLDPRAAPLPAVLRFRFKCLNDQ